MAFLADIATYLATKGIGTDGVTIFKGIIPEQVDEAIGLQEYAGDPLELIGNIEHPGLQVWSRSANYANARAKLKDIEDELHTLSNVVLGTTKYLSIFAVQSAVPMGVDSHGRTEMVQNYIVTKGR